MHKITATFRGETVSGTHEDLGLVERIGGPGYVSRFTFDGHSFEVFYSRDLAEANFGSSQIRSCHEKNCLDILGYTDLEIINGQ